MSESLTEGPDAVAASPVEPTAQPAPVTPPAETTQEAISGAKTQEAESTDESATKTPKAEPVSTDDGLAKFAKSQGFDPENLTDGEKRALKIAHDNQKAYRTANQPKVSDTAKELNKPSDDASDNEKVLSEINAFRYEQQTAQFWSEDGRDKELEPVMVQVLNEKKDQYGAAYAATLSKDLNTLYDLARLKSGAGNPDAAIEQGRREERESISKKSAAGAPPAHATSSAPSSNKIDAAWIANEYDAGNPEHRKLLDEAMARGDLY